MLSKKQLFTKGMLDISPHMLSVIPFGIICGAIGVELGFNPYLVYAMSIIIFGGASQIVFLQLLSGGASSLVAVTSVGIINSRHLLYGAVLSEYLEKLSFIKKLLISYFVVDQGFSESNKFFKKNKTEQHLTLPSDWNRMYHVGLLANCNIIRHNFRIICTGRTWIKIRNTTYFYSYRCSRF